MSYIDNGHATVEPYMILVLPRKRFDWLVNHIASKLPLQAKFNFDVKQDSSIITAKTNVHLGILAIQTIYVPKDKIIQTHYLRKHSYLSWLMKIRISSDKTHFMIFESEGFINTFMVPVRKEHT